MDFSIRIVICCAAMWSICSPPVAMRFSRACFATSAKSMNPIEVFISKRAVSSPWKRKHRPCPRSSPIVYRIWSTRWHVVNRPLFDASSQTMTKHRINWNYQLSWSNCATRACWKLSAFESWGFHGVISSSTSRKGTFLVATCERVLKTLFPFRYRCLLASAFERTDAKEITIHILNSLPAKFSAKYQIGITKVKTPSHQWTSQTSALKIFMRESLENHLEKERSQLLNKAAATIQRTLKGYIQRKNFERRRQATIVLQRQYRRWIDQKK